MNNSKDAAVLSFHLTLTPKVPPAVVIKLIPTAVVIKLIPTAASGTTCPNSTAATVGNDKDVTVPGLLARATALHALPASPVAYGVTETRFEDGILEPTGAAAYTFSRREYPGERKRLG
jgi:hypothetical protein